MNFFFETLKCCFMPMYSHYIKNVSCSVVKHLYSRQLRYFFNENCSYETVKNLKPIRFFVIFRRFVVLQRLLAVGQKSVKSMKIVFEFILFLMNCCQTFQWGIWRRVRKCIRSSFRILHNSFCRANSCE